MNRDLPFVVEYSKSNRASCKICKKTIGKDSLRMGVMVQSHTFDAKVPHWHHSRCFFDKKTVSSVDDIANFDNLRWEDQNLIKENIAEGPKSPALKGKKCEFSIEYSKSSRAACRTCSEKIIKDHIRISKLMDIEAPPYRPVPRWHHVDCFVKDRLELDFLDSATALPGYESLTPDDRKMILGKLKQLGIKRKAEDTSNIPIKKLQKEDTLYKAQNALLFEMRDTVKSNLSKTEMIMLLEHNNQHVPAGENRVREHLSDCLLFGAITTCPVCKSARPRYKIDTYRCAGNVTEWTKCQYTTRCPEREEFKILEEFKEKFDFLKDYKYVKRDRILPEKEVPKPTATKGALSNLIVAVFGRFSIAKKEVDNKIMELGGVINPIIDSSVKCCISTAKDVGKNGKNVQLARDLDIHIVSMKFLDDVQNGSSLVIAIKENLLCEWGGDPILKFVKQENAKIQAPSTSSSKYKSVSQKIKVSVKGNSGVVFPESGKEDSCHVYTKKDDIYTCVLNFVELSRGTNSYYKIQILKDDKEANYWLFRTWGRVGTTIGNKRLEKMSNVAEAIKMFKEQYLDKTGNAWENRKNFVKKPDCYYPLDIDYGQEPENAVELKLDDNCKLSKAVQELMCLIFDIEAMKKTMVEFEIDLQKMPLGKLSRKQIEQAYSVLNEAQQIMVTGCNSVKVLDASNRFYTLIPHDFGLRTPPLLDNEELIKSKIEMLDSLLEIEFAYNLLKRETDSKDQLTEHYEKLQTDIDVLDEKSEEYKIIKTYVKNTHADTHNMYNLTLNKVFKINRHGESERYCKFQKLKNKKLLWHGSRLTNFVGILSQGLRIAPPEAPSTGYMFGKGVYFADMVSKSANYCATSKKNPTALLLLCEVALGNMYEKTSSEFVTKLPKNKHSTKGVGMTEPDPKDKTFIGDAEVPFGKPVKSDNKNNSYMPLLYNEYIVYDVNQINIKYLLEVSLKWKY